MKREAQEDAPPIIEFHGNPKEFVVRIVKWIECGKLTYNGHVNCEQTFRSLASVVTLINSETGHALSVETLITYVKQKRAGEWDDTLTFE